MKRQLTVQEYRRNDLVLLCLITAVFELILTKVMSSARFAEEPYIVSLAPAMTAITYMRWGWYGGLLAAFSGFLTCAFTGAVLNNYFVYILGNLFSLVAVPLLKKLGPERVRTTDWMAMGLPVLVLLLMQTGRAAVALALGADPATCVGFYLTATVNDLFTLLIIWIVRRLDGVYEEQLHYLVRVHEEMEREEPQESGGTII